jgi:hypothetical protein
MIPQWPQIQGDRKNLYSRSASQAMRGGVDVEVPLRASDGCEGHSSGDAVDLDEAGDVARRLIRQDGE